MGFLIGLHLTLVPLIWLCGGAAAVWGIVLLVQRRGVDRVLRVLLGVTVGVGIVQGLVGGLLFLLGGRPPGGSLSFLHFVYGAIVIAAIPVAYTYADNKSLRKDMLIFVAAALVVVAAAARAYMTGIGLPQVAPEERTAAVSPVLSGVLLQGPLLALGLPIVLAGTLKGAYDLTQQWAIFRRMRTAG